MRFWGWVLGLVLAGYGCSSTQSDDCPAGEERRAGQCVAVGTCGPGTRLEDRACTIVGGASSDAGGADGAGSGLGGSPSRAAAGAAGDASGSNTAGNAGSGGDTSTGAMGGAGAEAAGSAGATDGGGGAGGSGVGDGCSLNPDADSLTAVTFQINPAHTGGQPLSSLHAPLKRCWSRNLDSTMLSYPLIANGRVFLTGSSQNGGGRLYALSASDGHTLWGPIDLGSNDFGSGADAALDADKIFTVNGNSLISAFTATTGAPIWSRSVGDSIEPGAPVATGGVVYVVVKGTLHALDESTGAPLWTAKPGGSPTSIAYTPSLLILEYVEGDVTGLDPSSGSSLWHHVGSGSGGGGDIPVIYQDRVYATDFWGTNVILDSKGQLIGNFNTKAVPAFENGLGFFLASSTLEAHNSNGMVKWSFAGDQMLVSTPLAAGGLVYQGSGSGKLYALDELTGQIAWQDDVGAPIPAANQMTGRWPATGLAASGQLLIVPTTSGVVAYGN